MIFFSLMFFDFLLCMCVRVWRRRRGEGLTYSISPILQARFTQHLVFISVRPLWNKWYCLSRERYAVRLVTHTHIYIYIYTCALSLVTFGCGSNMLMSSSPKGKGILWVDLDCSYIFFVIDLTWWYLAIRALTMAYKIHQKLTRNLLSHKQFEKKAISIRLRRVLVGLSYTVFVSVFVLRVLI
jgi:hypothetical protein